MEEVYVVTCYNNFTSENTTVEFALDVYKTKEEAEKAAEYLNNHEEDNDDIWYSVITYKLKEKFIPEQED